MFFPSYTKIVLRKVEVTTSIGLAAWERKRPQRLVVALELYAGSEGYLRDVTSDSIIDYVPIYERIQGWRTRPHTELIETLVSELVRTCFESARVIACQVLVTKSEVLDQAEAAGVETFVHRRDYERAGVSLPRVDE